MRELFSNKDLEIVVIQPTKNWVITPATEVKITYKLTGFSVKCNATRSQHKNASICLEYIDCYLKGLANV